MLINFTFILFLIKYVFTFNFEPKLPVIKQGPKNSYFGYSVAEHLILDQNNRTSDALLLIGAPIAENQDLKSGLVYKCKLSTNKNDCVPLRIEDEKNTFNAIKDNQWLGVTVKSQGPGGFVMACAHRYILTGPGYQLGQGICYSLNQHLQVLRPWEPCFNRPIEKAHEQYSLAQAGVSGDISLDNEIIIGTPGPYTWRGTVFTNSINFQIRDDKKWYFVPVENDSPVDKYSYLGMSVVSGKMINNRMTYITGAPRSNGTGQVLLFTKRAANDRRSGTGRLIDGSSSKSSPLLVKELVIDGEQFASSFGYTLAVLDINGDKQLDLVVGAPFYYNSKLSHAGGAIYVYLNHQGQGPNEKFDQQLFGNPESRFGFALANLDDINKDGYQDLAVGSPYDPEGGAVYIYLGSENGLNLNPVQTIRASDIPTDIPNFRSFGYSLSGGIDVDENGYPDLLVGAYESDATVLLRTRPIIDIETSVNGKLENIDPTIAGCDEDRSSKLTCFGINVCFKIKPQQLRNSNQLQLEYKIEAETFENHRKYYRVKFNSSQDTDTPNIVKKIVQLSTYELSERDKCSKEVVYLKVNKDKSDIQNPIKFQLTFKLVTSGYKSIKQNDRLPDINRYPVLNKIEAQKIFEAKFHKDCGSDDVCESDLRLNAALSLKQNDDRVHLLELEEKQFNVTLSVSNRGEPAYDAKVYIEHHYGLNYVKMNVIRGDSVDCLPKKTYIECGLGNPYIRGESQFILSFSPNSALDDESKIYFKMHANTTSNDSFDTKNTQNFEVDVIRRAELEILGVENPSQALYGAVTTTNIENVDHIGPETVHKYIVANYGPWKARSVNIDIHWPYEMLSSYHKDSGKGLLYLVSANVTNGGHCTFPTNYQPNNFHLRTKREAIITSKEVKEDGKLLNIVQMDCKFKTAKCYVFTCNIPLLNIQSNAVITLVGRLWNATLVENYAHGINQVHIVSRAKVYLDKQSNIKPFEGENSFSTEASTKTRAYPDLSSLPAQRPSIWIIILAIIFGILILIGLVIALWKCGFFKRKKPDYIQASQEDDDY